MVFVLHNLGNRTEVVGTRRQTELVMIEQEDKIKKVDENLVTAGYWNEQCGALRDVPSKEGGQTFRVREFNNFSLQLAHFRFSNDTLSK